MRLHRFYTNEKIEPAAVGSTARYSGSEQWRKVFRFVSGDKVILFDGSGCDFVCEIKNFEKDTAEVVVTEVREIPAFDRETWLFAAVVKKDTFEWIVEKATELGVSHIVPVLAERTEKKQLNMERLNKIMIEAAEQSGRATLPVLDEIIDFEKMFDVVPVDMTLVSFDPSGTELPKIFGPKKSTAICIGPEGGWSPKELEMFKQKGVAIHSLGSLATHQILRAETAVVATLSLAQFS